ncbi:hypothetical protein AVEN_188388-1 [Araneus ventricosus]|uniref:Uncharacterized protein n=1 Tax=Araneus ventricosus TaxID=182803 RepID=A0A4Y2EA44_ARAVE|nr:hypothetical protein AVEN_188388-1 [Araneus ventricosus]
MNRSIPNWTRVPHIDCSVPCMVTQEYQNTLIVNGAWTKSYCPADLVRSSATLAPGQLPAQEVLGRHWTICQTPSLCIIEQLSLTYRLLSDAFV